MKKHYFLGLNAKMRHGWRRIWTFGAKSDLEALGEVLSAKYGGKAVLTKNGRTGLALALKAYFNSGDKIIVNGFTCYAVYEAVKAAGLTPVFADITREDLNFNIATLERVVDEDCAGIIVQNTLGNPVDMAAVERFAGKHGLIIIEDLAHCVGVKYADGREAGTVGAAAVLSFGKDKAIDTISGGAVVLRYPCKKTIREPKLPPKKADNLRARFYPLLAGMVRGLTRVHLGGAAMTVFLKLNWVEKSADNKLELDRTLNETEAKLALEQIRALKKQSAGRIREFYLVQDRDEALKELKTAGYYFEGFWYEKPISPKRYYESVHFPESECPEAVFVAEHVINLPTFYTEAELKPARKIVKKYLVGGENGQK